MGISENTCGHCLYHLPDADEWVCTNERSDLHGCFTGCDDACIQFERWEPVRKNPAESVIQE